MDFGRRLADQITRAAVLSDFFSIFDFCKAFSKLREVHGFWSSLGRPNYVTYQELVWPSNRLSFWELPSGTAACWHRELESYFFIFFFSFRFRVSGRIVSMGTRETNQFAKTNGLFGALGAAIY